VQSRNERCVVRGLVTGLVGGLVASWAMNQFLSAQSKLQQPGSERQREREQQKQQQEQRAADNPTVKVAEAVTRPMRGRELSHDQKKQAGYVVHYAFGTLLGGLYGALSEILPATKTGFGSAYGAAVWLGADEIMVPALKLSPPPLQSSLSQHLSGLGAHLVYGVTAEAVRRTLRHAS
jgi:putative membrane protein